MRQTREAEDKKRKAEARDRAKRHWDSALPCIGHAYLSKKGIKPHGARIASSGPRGGDLVIPLRDSDGRLHSLQFIDPDGEKLFLVGGRKRGCYFSLGRPSELLLIAEGFATAASIHEATGEAVAVAFDAGNLLPVARALRGKFPSIPLVIAADDDFATAGNPGLSRATEAAEAVGGRVAIPDFGDNRPEDATDFNDLHQVRGLASVKECIQKALDIKGEQEKEEVQHPIEWPAPQPFASRVYAQPYPLEALPGTIRAAVEEVQAFVQAPVSLVASSALAALSLAVQTHWDIKRAEKLTGPTGLFLLTIADSGERKSTCDGFFTKVIREYEAQQSELAKPLLKNHLADLKAWEARASWSRAAIICSSLPPYSPTKAMTASRWVK